MTLLNILILLSKGALTAFLLGYALTLIWQLKEKAPKLAMIFAITLVSFVLSYLFGGNGSPIVDILAAFKGILDAIG